MESNRDCSRCSGPLRDLGRYTHRVAISNHRLVSFAEDKVTFRWRDSAPHNEQKLITISLDEFLRRVLLHVLPKGFVRIRNFGFLANRRRATLLPLCFHLLGSAPQAEQDISGSKAPGDLWLCPKCGGPMMVRKPRPTQCHSRNYREFYCGGDAELSVLTHAKIPCHALAIRFRNRQRL
jgi:hypothetical protein